MDERVLYVMCRLVEAGIVRAGKVFRVAANFLKSKRRGEGGSASSPLEHPSHAGTGILDGPGEFQGSADALLRRPETTAVLGMVAAAIGEALAAEGYRAGEWAAERSKDEDRKLRIAQWVAPFQDPLSGSGFQATVRVQLGNFGTLHTTHIWVDLCREGERRNAPDSVSQALDYRNWQELSHAAACAAFHEQLFAWVQPDSALNITQRAQAAVADLTTILAP